MVYINVVMYVLLTLSDVFTEVLFIIVARAWDNSQGT